MVDDGDEDEGDDEDGGDKSASEFETQEPMSGRFD
jgi:hypothetical protein